MEEEIQEVFVSRQDVSYSTIRYSLIIFSIHLDLQIKSGSCLHCQVRRVHEAARGTRENASRPGGARAFEKETSGLGHGKCLTQGGGTAGEAKARQ